MNALTISLSIWGLVVTAFVVLMIYRGYLSQHETDQLFLSETVPSSMHQENDEIIRRTNSIEPPPWSASTPSAPGMPHRTRAF